MSFIKWLPSVDISEWIFLIEMKWNDISECLDLNDPKKIEQLTSAGGRWNRREGGWRCEKAISLFCTPTGMDNEWQGLILRQNNLPLWPTDSISWTFCISLLIQNILLPHRSIIYSCSDPFSILFDWSRWYWRSSARALTEVRFSCLFRRLDPTSSHPLLTMIDSFFS